MQLTNGAMSIDISIMSVDFIIRQCYESLYKSIIPNQITI